jgi:hypothetical protein
MVRDQEPSAVLGCAFSFAFHFCRAAHCPHFAHHLRVIAISSTICGAQPQCCRNSRTWTASPSSKTRSSRRVRDIQRAASITNVRAWRVAPKGHVIQLSLSHHPCGFSAGVACCTCYEGAQARKGRRAGGACWYAFARLSMLDEQGFSRIFVLQRTRKNLCATSSLRRSRSSI